MDGLELWKKAKQVIPGGNSLLSKRPERYSPDTWPTYYSKAKGIDIWDLNNKHYKDFAQMGIGSAILGYSNDEVDNKVIEAIKHGINTTLNCKEEVEFAELLCHYTGFDKVKFARTGGEAMSIAIRIARAASGKSKVAFSGYHGWHDWYLATNVGDVNGLSDHLLPGLNPNGVPSELKDTAIPFKYNCLESLQDVFNKHSNIGVIVIEGARYEYPTPVFLNAIQEMANKHKCVIIVDEITSGWRVIDGGATKLFNFKPDIVVFGKGIGNGYAISAVVGNSNVMEYAQDTFISSTFWTERIGYVAGLATIKSFIENKVWCHLNTMGEYIGLEWEEYANRIDLDIEVTDFKPLITFKFKYGELNSILETIFIQKMLERGYIASTSIYISYAHTSKDIAEYLWACEEVFLILKHIIDDGEFEKHLIGNVRETGFKRLN